MSDLVLSVRLTADGKGLVEVVGQGSDALDGFGREATQAGAASKKVGSDLKSLGNESKSLSDHLFSLKTLMGTVASVMLSNQALRMADDYKLLQGRIALATASTGDYVSVSEKLFAITQSNGAALEGSVGLFQSLARAAPELNATNDEVLTLTKLIQQTGVVSGASTQAMSAGMLQFGQAMAGGVLRAEEMNSLLENMPELANQIATGMGLTSGQLRLAVNDGKILSEDVFRVLLGQADEIQQKVDGMPLGLERASTMLTESMGKMLASVDETVDATGTLAHGLQSVSQWMDTITASDIDEALHTTTVVVTALATAWVTYRVAGLAVSAQQAVLATATAANAAASVGLSAALGVQTRMTVAQAAADTAHTAVLRAKAVAMGFLWGPGGVAIAAAAAIGAYMVVTHEAANETDALANSSDKLAGSMSSIAKVGISKQIDDVTDSITKSNTKIAGYQEIIGKLQGQAGAYARIAYFRNEVEKEQLTVDELKQKLVGLEATKSRIAGLKGGSKDTRTDLTTADEYGQQMAELARQAYPEATQSAEEYGVAQAALARQWLASQESAEAYGKRMFELARQAYPEATESAEEFGQRQAGIARQMLDEAEQLKQSLFSQTEALDTNYQRRAELIATNVTDEEARVRMLLLLEQQYQDEKLHIQEAGMTAEQKLWNSGWQGKVNIVAGAVGNIAQFLMAGNKRQFEIGKMLARASIVADTAQAIMKAWGQGGPFLGPTLAIAAAAQGALQLRNLNAAQFGGGGSVDTGGGAGVGGALNTSIPSINTPSPLTGLPSSQNAKPAQKIDIHVYGNMTDLAGLARDMRTYNIELARDVI